MPASPTTATTVSGAAPRRPANAGAHGRCGNRASHQRALDGSCAECGASREESAAPAPAPADDGSEPEWEPAPRRRWGLVAGLTAGALLAMALVAWALTPREADLEVIDARWEHRVHVDRWRVWDREGFDEDVPANAFDRREMGPRHHHDVEVLDHYDTETYSEQVACGEDCVDEPESCHESCSDDGNGFATCTETCTGGGRSCSTRYCSETRTREVAVYRDEPVYETWYGYRVWDWGEVRVIRASGSGVQTRWPAEDEVALGRDLGDGERERSRRAQTYAVTLREPDGEQHEYAPESLPELERFVPGSVHHALFHLGGEIEWADH